MHGWYSAQELAGLPGMPGTERRVRSRLKKFLPIARAKVRGKGLEYPLHCLPKETQEALLKRELAAAQPVAALAAGPATVSSSAPVQPPAGALPAAPAAAGLSFLTDRQRLVADARRAVLVAIERLMVRSGCSQEAAIHTILAQAAAGEGDAALAQALHLAHDPRGRKGAAGLPSLRTIKRWIAAEAHGKTLAPAIPQPEMRLPEWAAAFLAAYRQPQKPSIAQALRMAFPEGNGPTYFQAFRLVKKLSAVARETGRRGPREMKSILPFVRRDFSSLEPLDVVSADGHTFDAEVQHPIHGRPFRPEITTIVDIATRRIVGWSVALAESSWAVADAIRHCAEKHGLFAILYVDNGKGYDNLHLKDAITGLMGRLGFEIKHSLPYNSQARGVIERLHKTVWVEGAKLLPSFVGAAMDREARLAHYRLTRQAVKRGGSMPLIPWEVFLDFCAQRVADYNARPHGSLAGASPDLKWREFELKGWRPHTLAQADLDELFRPRVARQVRRGEVSLMNNVYFAQALAEFHGERVQVAYDIHDASKVRIYTAGGRYLCEAVADGNRRHYMPVAVVEQAREKRAEARLKRIKAKAAEVIEERDGRIVEEVWQPLVATPAAPSEVRPLPRSARPIAEVVDEWIALDSRIAAGEAVSEDDAYWHGTFPQHPAFRAEMRRRQEAGDEKESAAG